MSFKRPKQMVLTYHGKKERNRHPGSLKGHEYFGIFISWLTGKVNKAVLRWHYFTELSWNIVKSQTNMDDILHFKSENVHNLAQQSTDRTKSHKERNVKKRAIKESRNTSTLNQVRIKEQKEDSKLKEMLNDVYSSVLQLAESQFDLKKDPLLLRDLSEEVTRKGQHFSKHHTVVAAIITESKASNLSFPAHECTVLLMEVCRHCFKIVVCTILIEKVPECEVFATTMIKQEMNSIEELIEQERNNVQDNGVPVILIYELWVELGKGMHTFGDRIMNNIYEKVKKPKTLFKKSSITQPTDANQTLDIDIPETDSAQDELGIPTTLPYIHALPTVHGIWRKVFTQGVIKDVRLIFERVIIVKNSHYAIGQNPTTLRDFVRKLCTTFLELCQSIRYLAVQSVAAWQTQESEFPLEECRSILLEVSKECLDISNEDILHELYPNLEQDRESNFHSNLCQIQNFYEERKSYLLGRLDRACDAFDYETVVVVENVNRDHLSEFISIRHSNHSHTEDIVTASDFAI